VLATVNLNTYASSSSRETTATAHEPSKEIIMLRLMSAIDAMDRIAPSLEEDETIILNAKDYPLFCRRRSVRCALTASGVEEAD
jgi:hypothetical protein